MTRRCELTGKTVMSGNNVSHANRRTRRRFLPNLCSVTVSSDALGQSFRMRISTRALRSIDINGGLDAFLLKAKDEALSVKARRIKQQLKKSLAAVAE